ncbi:MAG: acyl carrier protein [Gammaproteobacteria bacterium]|nr:MAG: acyl carrier protein [Gammaproteobacteria bacterium]
MITKKVTEIIINIARCKAEDVKPEIELSALGLTSLDTITMLFELEEAFDIDIPNEVIPSIVTVGDILDNLKGISYNESA